MKKQAVDVFGDSEKRLPPPRAAEPASRGFGFKYIMRTAALGVALFAIVFVVFCFGTMLREAGDMHSEGEADTTVGVTSPLPPTETAPLSETLPPQQSGASPETLPPSYDIYAFDGSRVPDGEIAIVPKDMSLLSLGENYIYNETSHSPNIKELAAADSIPVFGAAGGNMGAAPLVLIIHTHGTEAYSPEGSISYNENDVLARSENIEENVISVGKVMCDVLNGEGIATLHCTVMHDRESYRNSYSRAAETIKKYLTLYPTVKYVIDIHRDSLSGSGGSLIRPVTVADGQAAAQVMCVVGSNLGGVENGRWEDNLSLALKLRSRLNDKYTNLCRPTCLRPSAYNQQYAPLSLLLELGASGNYLSEAKVTARLVAEELAEIIKN